MCGTNMRGKILTKKNIFIPISRQRTDNVTTSNSNIKIVEIVDFTFYFNLSAQCLDKIFLTFLFSSLF